MVDISYLILITSILSIFVGSFGGLQTKNLKTMLAYSSINQMGYSLLTFNSSYSLIALEALLFYMIIYILSGLSSWCILISLALKTKTKTDKHNTGLCDLTLLNNANPALAVAFSLTLFSIAGLPPLVGFLAKFSILQVFLKTFFYEFRRDSNFTTQFDCTNPHILGGAYNREYVGPALAHQTIAYSYHPSIIVLSIIVVLCSVVSTFYYVRVIKVMYFENSLIGRLYYPIKNQKTLILSFLVFLTGFLFINPNILYLSVHSVAILARTNAKIADQFTYSKFTDFG